MQDEKTGAKATSLTERPTDIRTLSRVSVLLPAYNVERFVDAAVESVRAQTFHDWEIVAVDDCSRDDTYERLQTWAKRESRLRCFRNDSNRGMTSNWNECLAHADGQLILKLDADDVLRPRTLELLVASLADSAVIGAGVRTLLCSEALEPFGALPADDAMMRGGFDPYQDQTQPCDRWYDTAAPGQQLWHSCAVMMRRSFLSPRGYDERLGCASDTELVWRMLEQPEQFAHHAYVGVLYRTVAGSVSQQYRANNWLTWEGCCANLLSMHRRRSRGLSRTLRFRYAYLWQRWQTFRRSPEAAALPDALRHNLDAIVAEVSVPPLKDRLLWRGREWLHRVRV
jgi:glycosyltransferase involved in cell wall biosynthesis